MSGGWVKVHRQLRSHWLWSDPGQLRAWLELIFRATYRHERKVLINGHLVTVPRGSVALSKVEFARELGWSRPKLDRYLKRLEDDNMVIQETLHKATLISLVNYEAYQDEGDETLHKTEQQTCSRQTPDVPADVTPYIKKERKEGKRREKESIREVLSIDFPFPPSLERADVRAAISRWCSYRAEIGRPVAAATLEENFRYFSNRPDALIESIQRSIALGYVGLLPAAAPATENEPEPEWMKSARAERARKEKLQ